MAQIAIAVAVNVASGAISRKIAGDPEQPKQIGSGTSPSISPGPTMEVAPVEGSKVQEFGDFTLDNISEPESAAEAEYILQTLTEAGIDPNTLNEYGIAGMSVGGYLNRANGGGLSSLLSEKGADEDLLDFLRRVGIIAGDRPEITSDILKVDFSETEEPSPEDLFEKSMFADFQGASPEIGPLTRQLQSRDYNVTPTVHPPGTFEDPEPNVFEKSQGWIDSQDPMVSDAIYKGLGSIGSSIVNRLFGDDEKPKGSMVKTKTLPAGNSNRRRAALEITPIGGSSVSFADGGSVLKRPMFMPSGGAMYGPGNSKDDLIPVMASNGEYMLSKAAVDAAGDGSHAQGLARLDAFNKMGNMRYG